MTRRVSPPSEDDAKRRNKPLEGTEPPASVTDKDNPEPSPRDGKIDKDVLVAPLPIERRIIPIVGESPLVVHAWGPKAKKEMRDFYAREGKATKKTTYKKQDPTADFLDCFYVVGEVDPNDPNAVFGIPAAGISKALQTAAIEIDGLTAATIRRNVRVMGDENGLVPLKSHSGWRRREDMVNITPAKRERTPGIRYRPAAVRWKLDVTVRYISSIITETQIANLLRYAGFAVGLCEWRPEKGGEFGTWDLDPEPDVMVDVDEFAEIAAPHKKRARRRA